MLDSSSNLVLQDFFTALTYNKNLQTKYYDRNKTFRKPFRACYICFFMFFYCRACSFYSLSGNKITLRLSAFPSELSDESQALIRQPDPLRTENLCSNTLTRYESRIFEIAVPKCVRPQPPQALPPRRRANPQCSDTANTLWRR